jgi:hypothetical protein
MFSLAERRAQQSMLKTYWTPDTTEHADEEEQIDMVEEANAEEDTNA